MNRWFDDTISRVQAKGKSLRQIDPLFVGILQCAREYCNSALCLLMNNHAMSAAAILRILFELYVKLCWCLQAPDKSDHSDGDSCFRRFRQWDYRRAIEHRTLLQELRKQSGGTEESDIDKTIQRLTCQITEFKSQQLPQMPNIAEMCKALSNDVNEDWARTYPGIYRRFNREIHVDMNLVRQIVQVSGTEIRCLPEPPGYNQKELLSYCVVGGFNVNRAVRNHHGWDWSELHKECGDLVEGVAKIKDIP